MTHPSTADSTIATMELFSELQILPDEFLPPLLLLILILALISFRATIGLSVNKMFFNLDNMMFKSIFTTFHHALSMCSVRQRRRPHQCRRWINEIYSGSFVSPIDR